MSQSPPPLASRLGRRRVEASAEKANSAGTMPPMRFRVKLRRLDSGDVATLAGFIRLTAHGAEQPAELGRMPAGSRITWAGACWEVVP